MKKRYDTAVYRRVREAFASAGITRQIDMGKVCGVGQTAVSKWATGENCPTTRNMIDISNKTGYAVQWLFTGKGEKRVPEGSSDLDQLRELLDALSPEDRKEVIRFAQWRHDESNPT